MTNFVKTMILFGIISSIIYNIFNLKFADKFLLLKDGLLNRHYSINSESNY